MAQFWHWLVGSEVGHFVLYMIASNAIGSMPAPTATANPFYVWAFRFLNGLASNLTRAYSAKVEKSPNFQDAVALKLTNGGTSASQTKNDVVYPGLPAGPK
jgi:hypothetical protein